MRAEKTKRSQMTPANVGLIFWIRRMGIAEIAETEPFDIPKNGREKTKRSQITLVDVELNFGCTN
jgi:hypothetical protein